MWLTYNDTEGVMIMVRQEEATIIAQCTPKGSGAIALIRISGSDALRVANTIGNLASGKKLTAVTTHTIHYGSIRNENKERIDQVLFMVMHAPKTFTGQDTVEITCHNNPFIIDAIIICALKAGAQLAHEGEFTKRAVVHKKIDLVQAEAINDLIHANTQQALKLSLSQLNGTLSRWIQEIEQKLLKAIAFSEASFEFIDEESKEFGPTIKQIISNVLLDIKTIKQTFDQQKQIRQGIRIALIGSVNAGKSSLFNALLGQDRAIVTDTAGTTRDVIETGIYQEGSYWTLIDTAGLRQTEHTIEQEGIKRSRQEAQKADIILLVVDGSRPLDTQEQTVYQDLYKQYQHKIILIHHKADLPQHAFTIENKQIDGIATSTEQTHTLQIVKQAIQTKIAHLFATLESPFLLNQRQFHLLSQLETNLTTTLPLLQGTIQYELLSYHLSDSLSQLAELTGKSISDKGMDAIFKEFCIGK